jgi:hypothetical protein
MAALYLGSPWAPYGLWDDPFFQQPLQPTDSEEAPRPITLFVGRDAELTLVANQILGGTTSRAILEGDAGVGKTSFVSRLKTVLGEHGVLMHADPVRVRPGMTAQQFVAEVLKVLLQIWATVNAHEGSALQKVRRAAKREAAMDQESAFWRRVGRLIQGEDSIAAGVNVAMLGAQREHVRIPAEVSDVSLFGELAEAFAYLSRRGERKVLIHVNNLENLTLQQAEEAARLVQQVRDCFLFDYSHWLFVGTTGITDNVFRASEQVRGIIPFTIALNPLAPEEVAELLKRRYQHLRQGQTLIPPITAADGATLYRRYHGQLRAFLSLLSHAVQRHAGSAPGTPLTVPDVVTLMAPTLRAEKLVARIGVADTEALRKTTAGRPYDAEIRVTDIETALGVNQAAASRLVQRLVQAGVLRKTRTQGKSVYYSLAHGDLTVALNLA